MRLTRRGKVVMVVLAAAITTLLLWLVHKHDVAQEQQCLRHAYECNHLNPKWFVHGEENP